MLHRLPSRIDASFCHYMQLSHVVRQQALRQLVKQLADESPELDAMLRDDNEWREVLAASEHASGN